jgi:hypothetical protein
MDDPRPTKAATAAELAAEGGSSPSNASLAPAPPPEGHVKATHAILFTQADDGGRCDACGEVLADETDDGYAVRGAGAYLWTRGDERRYEPAPLCARCAAAIGMSALSRWEIEEEEG